MLNLFFLSYNEDEFQIEYKKITEEEWKSVLMPIEGELNGIFVKNLEPGTL
jgi:hypothetical protein